MFPSFTPAEMDIEGFERRCLKESTYLRVAGGNEGKEGRGGEGQREESSDFVGV